MWLFGFSINVLTLLAIVLATGLVVDDGIVVTKIYLKKVESMTPIEAAIKGSNEIFCSNFYFYHAGSSIPTGYISRRICRTFI
jgi:predicted RND superfamily exporter protein